MAARNNPKATERRLGTTPLLNVNAIAPRPSRGNATYPLRFIVVLMDKKVLCDTGMNYTN
jgi:hypothetical protein